MSLFFLCTFSFLALGFPLCFFHLILYHVSFTNSRLNFPMSFTPYAKLRHYMKKWCREEKKHVPEGVNYCTHSTLCEKAHGNGNVMTHCEFCHPLCFTEELQVQSTPTSHGSFQSSVVRESSWMRKTVVLTAAVGSVGVITTCQLWVEP